MKAEKPTVKLTRYIAQKADLLSRSGIESARAEIEWILCHVLDVDRLNLYMHGEKLLGPGEQQTIDEIIKRRQTRHPLQFILQEAFFYGRKFYVNENVMAPTPETEGLCEVGIKFITSHSLDSPRILDIGTGSGVICVTMACELADASVVAVDISQEALEVGKRNAADQKVSAQIEFRQSDFLAALKPTEKFDLILSNPPYICEPDYAALDPEVRADPKIAMTAGEDGLDAIRVIIADGPDHLLPGGRIMFEIGYGQAVAIAEIVSADERYQSMTFLKDLNDIDRIAILSAGESDAV